VPKQVFARRMDSIPFSGIRKVFEEVTLREKRGEKVVHLEIGRPDFDTPEHIKEEAKRALDRGAVHYTSNYGELKLREAISKKLQVENGISADPSDEIVVTVGTNEAVFMAMMALLDPGDEVLIPDPCWLHYFYCAEMAGARPVSVPLREENGFKLMVDDLESRVTPKTKLMVMNTPHNPTGMVMGVEDLEAVSRFAEKHDLYVLADEIYERMLYGKARHKSMASFPGMKERTITVNGFSKIYSMTGWRLGYLVADRALMKGLIRIHQYTTVCACSFAQWGGVAALNGSQKVAEQMVAEFDRRRQLVSRSLREIPGISFVEPQGAFYIFPNIRSFGMTSEEMARYILEEAKAAVVPGNVFGAYGEGYIRISYANSYENLEKAMTQIQRALKKLRQ